MNLRVQDLKKGNEWQEKGYELPKFDLREMKKLTSQDPIWLHFGAGNIFRALPAALHQTLLDNGLCNSGITVCEAFDEEIIRKIYDPYDNLSVVVSIKSDGTMQKKVIGSIADALTASDNIDKLAKIFTSPSLQMVSFTITEKGYSLADSNGEYFPQVLRELENFPSAPKTIMGLVAMLCYKRYQAGRLPIALVSMDNFFHNGDKLYEAINTFATNWAKNGLVDPGFVDYINDPKLVTFPWSMIDKITPRPSERIEALLESDGLKDMKIICTSKNTYIAPFVNTEHVQYLVIEDTFPNSRPPLEKAGVIFTDRDTVDKVERMKVCTCLNPLHSMLAIFGCLLGYKAIFEEMRDSDLKSLIERAGYDEMLPVAVNPGIIDPEQFMREVIEERLPNPFVPDTPQRIACDTSQKIPIRFGETLKAHIAKGHDITALTYIPLFFAGWLRYLIGIDDKGEAFELSPDPMVPELHEKMKHISIGDKGPFGDILRPILSNKLIFGIDLCEHGLAPKIEGMLEEMLTAPGAVRRTLNKYVNMEVDMS
ncbi:mannitol dehydrogenase family protein [Acetomicrobium thermoterrenum]|nr:mannitol dehydrogenase family protein [Acetomicrobium thermoterrenum]